MLSNDWMKDLVEKKVTLVVAAVHTMCPGGDLTLIDNLAFGINKVGRTPLIAKVNPSTEDHQRRSRGMLGTYQNLSRKCIARILDHGIPAYAVVHRAEYKKTAPWLIDMLRRYPTFHLIATCAFGIEVLQNTPGYGKLTPEAHGRILALGRALQLLNPRAGIMPLPYLMHNMRPVRKMALAVCPAVLDWNSHASIIMKHNDICVNHENRVRFMGRSNSKFVKTNLLPHNPLAETLLYNVGYYERVGKFMDTLLSVDLTVLPGDSARLRYHHLEAWNDYCIPVVNSKWFNGGLPSALIPFDGGNIGESNCFAVSNHVQLSDVINTFRERFGESGLETLSVRNGRDTLKKHVAEWDQWAEAHLS